MAMGAVLVKNYSHGFKLLHGGVGFLGGLASLEALYLLWQEKASLRVRSLSAVSVIMTLVAGIGGKIGEKHFDTGVMIMRLAGLLAIVFAIGTLMNLRKVHAHRVSQE